MSEMSAEESLAEIESESRSRLRLMRSKVAERASWKINPRESLESARELGIHSAQ